MTDLHVYANEFMQAMADVMGGQEDVLSFMSEQEQAIFGPFIDLATTCGLHYVNLRNKLAAEEIPTMRTPIDGE